MGTLQAGERFMAYIVSTAVFIGSPIVFILSPVVFEIPTIEQSEERGREGASGAVGKTARKQ